MRTLSHCITPTQVLTVVHLHFYRIHTLSQIFWLELSMQMLLHALTSLERVKPMGADMHCGCILNTQVTHLWPCSTRSWPGTFVWLKIVPGWPLVWRPDKEGFTEDFYPLPTTLMIWSQSLPLLRNRVAYPFNSCLLFLLNSLDCGVLILFLGTSNEAICQRVWM